MSVSNAVQTFSHSPNHAVDLDEVNPALAQASAEDRVAWALERFGSSVVLTSSFGAQAAVCLHLVTRQRPDIPVILVDTGYLFPETYRYIDALTERLELNLKVYRAELSPAWQEARFGRLWEQGVEGLDRYNEMNKVEPMQRALRELGAKAWIAGLRRLDPCDHQDDRKDDDDNDDDQYHQRIHVKSPRSLVRTTFRGKDTYLQPRVKLTSCSQFRFQLSIAKCQY